MTSRERVKKAVRFEGPDRIPHYLPDGKENDILWCWVDGPGDIEDWHEVNGHLYKIDRWGVTWETKGGGSFGEAVGWPVADISTHTNYKLPDLNNPKYFRRTKDQIEANNRTDNPKYCLGTMPFNSIHADTHKLTGLENMFAAYYEHPEALKSFLQRMAEAQKESIKMLYESGCDGVMATDDWGLQTSQMISTELMNEFFIPHYRSNWLYAWSLGMDVWLHSCGYTLGLHALFAENGLSVIQLDQQENMGLDNINAAAGGKLAYWCPVDIQKTMVEGNLDDIEMYAKRMIETLGSHNGGFISMSYGSPQAVGHTQEKIDRMCQAFRKYEKLGLE